MKVKSEINTLLPLSYLLPLIILLEGFVSISSEILTIRQLLPVAGGSVIVTSIVIGIFLLFLAIGYHHGGKQTGSLQKILRRNFFLAAIGIGIGLSYLFIIGFFALIQRLSGPHVVYPLVAYLLLVTAPLIYLLGQTVPISINLMKQEGTLGRLSGNTLALSTIGSFLGALFSTLVLMYFFGVAVTIFLNTILLLMIFLLLTEKWKDYLFEVGIVASALILFYAFNIGVEKNSFYLTDQYANYQILNHHNFKALSPNEKILMINDAPSSYTNGEKKGFVYIETIKTILFNHLRLSHANILVLGTGAFSLSAESTFSNTFTYVDIDRKIKPIAENNFGIKQNNFIVDDARHFLNSTNKKYDAIIADAYSDVKFVAPHLLTYEYMQSILRKLTPNGVAIFNIIANPMLSDPYSKRVDNTIRSVFHNCMVVPQLYQNDTTNILYICANSEKQADNIVYSDNLNNSTIDSFMW